MANRFDPERSHRLDAPERAEWQKPGEVVDALSLSDGDCVVEVGSGTGYFTRLISRSVGDQGKVVAVDSQERMLDALRARCDAEGLTNVQLVAAPGEASTVEGGIAEVVFLANVTHEFDDLHLALREARRVIRPGGRIAVLDWARKESDVGPPLDHRLSETDLRIAADAVDLEPLETHTFLPHHYFVIFTAAE